MWKYVKLCSNNSPMAEILSKCYDKLNLSLVVYHLIENHVECATVAPSEVTQFFLGDTVKAIKQDARNGAHAILAFDLAKHEVYLIDSTPDLNASSAVLLCVVTELLNGDVQSRQCQCGRPEVRYNTCPRQEEIAGSTYRDLETLEREFVAQRDAHGRFVRKAAEPTSVSEKPWEASPTFETAESVVTRRFRLGRR